MQKEKKGGEERHFSIKNETSVIPVEEGPNFPLRKAEIWLKTT